MLFNLIRRENLGRDGKLWRFEGTRVICKGFQDSKLALKRESHLEWRLRFEGLTINHNIGRLNHEEDLIIIIIIMVIIHNCEAI